MSEEPTLSRKDGLRHGPLGADAIHLCVDMQRLFAEQTKWHTPWMERVLPNVLRIARHQPDRAVYTRFIPAERPGEGRGTWRQYWQHWSSMTLDAIGPDMAELVPDLAALVPPGEVVDKRVYAPWQGTDLDARLRRREVRTLIVTGGETDVCVLATVLGAVDLGYRIVLVTDALCSSSDETHDALLTVYHNRYGQQVETVTTDEVVAAWA